VRAQPEADRIAALRLELASKDQKRIDAARQQVLALPKPERVNLFRAAIWSKDPQAAVWSANKLKYDQVDLREAARVVDLLLPELRDQTVLAEDEMDFDNLRQLLGGTELPRVFRSFPRKSEYPSPGVIISQIHRQIRVPHIPALCQLAMHKNLRVAEPALDNLMGAIAPHTNQHREAIGLALLHRLKVAVPAAERNKKRDGYPLVLFRCLENFQRFDIVKNRGGVIRNWIWRWACDEKAGPADREVLLRLRAMDSDLARSIATHGRGDFPDAVRGQRNAKLLFHQDPKQRAVALALCTEDRYDLALAGVHVQPAWFEGLAMKLPDTELPGLHLARVVMYVPGFRRIDLAKLAVRQPDLKPPKHKAEWSEELEDFLAFLEVCAPDHLRMLLATWATSDNKELRNHARELQLKIGDETSVNELIAVLERQELHEDASVWLAKIKSSKVEAFLRRRAMTKDSKTQSRYLHALAVHYGLPESVGWERRLDPADDAVFNKARQLVLDKKPIDALVHVLRSLEESESYVRDLGLVRDPRVTKYLEQVQSRRYLGRYVWATSQLGIQGNSKAREEFWNGCLIGRYRWIDNSNVRALTLNYDLETIPFWLTELETNCCRRNNASQVFEHLFGLDLYRDNQVFPEVVPARAFWERYRNNLKWSRIKGHYVPGPDR